MVEKFIKWAMEHGLIKNLILCLFIVYVLVTYNSQYMTWYNENIIPILGHFESNIWIFILSFIMIFVAIYDIVIKVKVCYQYDKKVMLPLCTVTGLLISCRISELYNYVYWIWIISYVDIIMFFCCIYIIIVICNKCKMYYRLYWCKDEFSDGDEKNEDNDSLLNDWPIVHKEEDIFDLKAEVTKLTDRITKLDRKKTWSVAITAPWGTGKTSFMNLMLENISEKDFEIVRFSPRDCKSFKTIQEEFFNSIACVLSKYDSRCSNTLKNYMASLKLIDNRDVVEKLTKFYRIWDKESLKESIKCSFASLDKKVLVLIDDFDRLSKDEILEVLKLIDSNAAFTNLVFLTAYDKVQVDKSLGDSYKTKDACFVDKFFNLEFSIPSRPYSYISRYIEDKLCELLNVDDDEKKSIQQTLTKQITIFGKYLPTLRDAKRYINQFNLDFQEVRGDVMIDEFLLVQLIKYRHPEHYKSLYKKEYVKFGIDHYPMNILCLSKDIKDDDKEILDVLKQLFPEDKSYNDNLFANNKIFGGNSYKHIYNNNSFENYFVNQIYGSLRIRDMRALFSLEWNEVTSKIDEWVTNDNQSKDYCDYLDSFCMDNFENGDKYKRYTEMVTHLACKLPNSRAYWLFRKIIYNQNIKDYDKKYELDLDSYKRRLLEILEKDKDLTLMGIIHYDYKTKRMEEDEYLIHDSDVWPYIKNTFVEMVKGKTVSDGNILSWLYRCVDHMEETSRKLHLDIECLNAYRKRVEDNPSYYIKTFVRLGMVSSSPDWNSVACEPFWRQIFGDEFQFENFLNECREKRIEKSDLVWNFWQLYKANEYEPISYENQGSVQEKIDKDLVDEVEKLNKMKDIEKEVLKISDNDLLDAEKDKYLTMLSKEQKELNEIRLDIVLKKTINDLINNKKQAINKD